jgi:D-beta-D-heptose 7-phosphate kinase/D-beta-D-heptose 1-phosphate adenosyltransferase
MASLILKFGVDHLESYQNCIFTNGCFDILHRGHIELFRFCYKQSIMGRPAVVGVNSDRSIKELKGTNRPIMGEEDRLAVLKAIKWIDYIVVFDTKSVFPVIESLKPKVLVKGGNYSKKACAEKDRIVGEEFVESYGGKVATAPYVEGISTTEIIRRIMVPIPERH